MEEPSTPSSDMWWKLMGDDPNTSKAQRTPITPKSFHSLWARPETVAEESSGGDHDSKTETCSHSSETKGKSAEKRQKRESSEEIIAGFDEASLNVSSGTSPKSLRRTPIERITVTHQDRALPTSPLSVHTKRNTRADDAFDDRGSYMGTADKFLDAIEDRICTLEINSPSIADIEKRIEASWKDIESRTAQFFKCRRDSGCPEAERIATSVNNPKEKGETPPKRFSMGCQHGGVGDKDDGNDRDGAIFKSTASDDSEEEEDFSDDGEQVKRGSLEEQHAERRLKEGSDVCEGDDAESTVPDTVDLNSYALTFMDDIRKRRGTLDIGSVSQPVISSGSMDFDASTVTTVQTQQSMTTTNPPVVDPSCMATPPLPLQAHPLPPPNSQQSGTTVSNTSVHEPLAIFEPTNSTALLVNKYNATKRAPPRPTRLSAGGTGPEGHDPSQMPDLESNFQKSCFSPRFKKKKNDASLRIANTASTSSSDPSCPSGRSIESKSEAIASAHQCESNSHHAYIAYFERCPNARKSMRLYEHPTPPTFPTLNQEIVVRIAYSTISHTDCAIRKGTYWSEGSRQPLNLPIIPGVTFSGYVTQLNRASMRTGLRYGDRVISLVRVGANARHLCIARDRVVSVPDTLKDDKRIACLPEIYLGAFQALHIGQRNGVRYKKSSLAGKTILILGGATILGRALIELCHAAGSNSVYATGKPRHFPLIEGAEATPLNRDPRHWYSLLKGRVDLIVGLDNDSFRHSEASAQHLDVLSSNGRAVLIGAPERTCDAALDNRKRIFVYNVFDSWEKDIKQGKRDLSHLCKLLVDGAIDPHVLETIPLCQVAQAQDAVEHRDFSSFLLCDPWMQTKRKLAHATSQAVLNSETDVSASSSSLSLTNKTQKRNEKTANRSSGRKTAGAGEHLLSV